MYNRTIIFTVTALAVSLSPCVAKETIRCVSSSGPEAVITMLGRRVLGREANCLNADFMGDGSQCAPAGSYVVSFPTGTAGPKKIATRWQDYMDENGPVLQSIVTDNKTYFEGGFVMDTYTENFSFDVDRLTGKAVLKIPKGDRFAGEHHYNCTKTAKKF